MVEAEKQGKEQEVIEKVHLRIGVMGSMGMGKTTIARALAERWTDANLIEETYQDNPYLERFYEDPEAYSFRSQVRTIGNKIAGLTEAEKDIVQIIDLPPEMDMLFAEAQRRMDWMSEDDYQTYLRVCRLLLDSSESVKPDIYIVLTTEKKEDFSAGIRARGRDFEKGVSQKYLERLNEVLTEWKIQGLESKHRIISVSMEPDNFSEDPRESRSMKKKIDFIESRVGYYSRGLELEAKENGQEFIIPKAALKRGQV